jgi:hypothetical protein
MGGRVGCKSLIHFDIKTWGIGIEMDYWVCRYWWK